MRKRANSQVSRSATQVRRHHAVKNKMMKASNKMKKLRLHTLTSQMNKKMPIHENRSTTISKLSAYQLTKNQPRLRNKKLARKRRKRMKKKLIKTFWMKIHSASQRLICLVISSSPKTSFTKSAHILTNKQLLMIQLAKQISLRPKHRKLPTLVHQANRHMQLPQRPPQASNLKENLQTCLHHSQRPKLRKLLRKKKKIIRRNLKIWKSK